MGEKKTEVIDKKLAYQLDDIDKKIIQLKRAFPRITAKEIAFQCGVSDQTVRYRCNKPAMKAAWEDLTRSTDDLLKEAAREAVRTILKHLKHKDPKVALTAAKMALAPYLNQHSLNVQADVRTWKTDVSQDGSLIQTVIEAELGVEKKENEDGDS